MKLELQQTFYFFSKLMLGKKLKSCWSKKLEDNVKRQ